MNVSKTDILMHENPPLILVLSDHRMGVRQAYDAGGAAEEASKSFGEDTTRVRP